MKNNNIFISPELLSNKEIFDITEIKDKGGVDAKTIANNYIAALVRYFGSKQNLVHHIICDGEPEDEGCVGHLKMPMPAMLAEFYPALDCPTELILKDENIK